MNASCTVRGRPVVMQWTIYQFWYGVPSVTPCSTCTNVSVPKNAVLYDFEVFEWPFEVSGNATRNMTGFGGGLRLDMRFTSSTGPITPTLTNDVNANMTVLGLGTIGSFTTPTHYDGRVGTNESVTGLMTYSVPIYEGSNNSVGISMLMEQIPNVTISVVSQVTGPLNTRSPTATPTSTPTTSPIDPTISCVERDLNGGALQV